MSRTEIHVEGMVCQSCVQNIEQNLSKVSGVSEVSVSLEEKLARVAYDPALTNPQQLAEEIEDLGFEATPPPSSVAVAKNTCTIGVGGMTCQSCVDNIESGLRKIAGVQSVTVSLKKAKAFIIYNGSEATVDDFKTAIEDMRFIVTGVFFCTYYCTRDQLSSPRFILKHEANFNIAKYLCWLGTLK